MAIVRSAPWVAVIVSTSAAAMLLTIGGFSYRTGIGWLSTLLGLSTCGAAAAYVLDEQASEVADASPTSRAARTTRRLPIALLPLMIALAGLIDLNVLDASNHWLRLAPLAAGSIAIGVAFAAGFRRRGWATPGDLAAVLALTVVVLVVLVDPMARWIELAPLGETSHPGRGAIFWLAVVIVAGFSTARCSRDPASTTSRRAKA
jgi:hypothetical protein